MATILEQLELHEGSKRFPYVDTVGKITIGIGFNLTDVGLYPDEIRYILKRRVATLEIDLNALLPWYVALDDIRQKVLIDMAYNLGVAGLLTFKSFLRAMSEQRWEDAVVEMQKSKWWKQVGARAGRLARMVRTGSDYDAV